MGLRMVGFFRGWVYFPWTQREPTPTSYGHRPAAGRGGGGGRLQRGGVPGGSRRLLFSPVSDHCCPPLVKDEPLAQWVSLLGRP